MTEHTHPLILSLRLDGHSYSTLDALRRAHFPPHRNIVPTHITLFHALPGAHEESVRALLQSVCDATPPPELTFGSVRFLGRGVAVEASSPALVRVRQRLAHEWADWLSAQDQQRYKPHCTIQNKADPAQARAVYEQLAASWQPFDGQGEALVLWRYIGGPWEHAATFPFGGEAER